MSQVILYCEDPYGQNCRWMGGERELVNTDEDPDNYNHCPHCGGTDFYEEEEDDEDDEDDIIDDEEDEDDF